VDEYPSASEVLLTMVAKTNSKNVVTYSIAEQSVEGALKIDGASGEMKAADPSLFNVKSHASFTATIKAMVDDVSATAKATITLKDVEEPFVTSWETTEANDLITIPVKESVTYKYTIDWGDGGNPDKELTTKATHTYATPGTYKISITGTYPAIAFDLSEDREKLKTIEAWGDQEWESISFKWCTNLTYNATDVPDLHKVTDMSVMFGGATSFNGDISNWDVSSATDMGSMFSSATSFNGDLSKWNVSNVTNMSHMFDGASSFNSDISSWDVGKVTDMSYMFRKAASFKGDLSKWNVSSVTNFQRMFSDASLFKSDISRWDVSSGENFSAMFYAAGFFDISLGRWDISKATQMAYMLAQSGMSIANYDATLNGWSQLATVPTRIAFAPSGMIYCSAANARNFLMTKKFWSFSGDNLCQ